MNMVKSIRNNTKTSSIRTGDIILVELKGDGNLQSGKRPCLVVSNNMANKYSPVITILPFTSRANKRNIMYHLTIYPSLTNGLSVESTLLCEQTTSINKTDIIGKLGEIEESYIEDVGRAMLMQAPILVSLFDNKNFTNNNNIQYLKRLQLCS